MFTDRDAAYDLAQGKVRRTDLIKKGCVRVMHRAGWEKRVADHLSRM